MVDYYENGNDVLQMPAVTGSFQARQARPAVVVLLVVLCLGACWLATAYGPAGPLTPARLREAMVLIQTTDRGQPVYSTGWLCRPNVVVAADSAVRTPEGQPRQGVVVYVNGGREKCAMQGTSGRNDVAVDAGRTVQENVGATVFAIQPPRQAMRPLLVNADPNAVCQGMPLRICGMNKENQALSFGPERVTTVERVESTHFVYLKFQGQLIPTTLGAAAVDARDGRVVGFLDRAPTGGQAAEHRAVSVSLLRPALEKHAVPLALQGQ